MATNVDATSPSSNAESGSDENNVLEGFLLNLSPNSSNKFDYGLQTKEKTYKVNCYNQPKRKLFEDGSPARIKNFKLGANGNIINVDAAELVVKNINPGFTPTKIAGDIQIISLTKCVRNQFVNLKGVLSSLNKPRTNSNGTSRDCCLTDSTGSVKAVLWGDHVNSVKAGTSYELSNVRVDFDQYSNPVIHTAREDCKINEIKDVVVPANTPKLLSPSKERSLQGEFMGVDTVEFFKKCFRCKKKIKSTCDGAVVDCTNPECKLTQKSKALIASIYARVVFQDSTPKHENHSVTLFDDVIYKMIPNAKAMSDKQIERAILALPPCTMTYVPHSKIVVQVDIDV